MKLPKVSAVVAAAVLASAADAPRPTGASGPDTGSAGTPDAAPTDAGQEDLDRAEVRRILADKASGVSVREAAEKALAAGTAAALREFLTTGLQNARYIDCRVDTVRILGVGGPAVKKAAETALRGSYEDLVAFLKEGQHAARAQDDRAEIERLLADPATGPGVREAGQKALDTGTPAALRHFVETELPVQREHDARVALSQIMAKGGPEVRAAANAAMDGSYADVVKFLQEGQYTARAKDNRAQVAQIAETGGPAVKKAALAALDGNEQAVATFLLEGWAKARAEDEAAAKPGTEPTVRPTEQPTTAPAAPAAQTSAAGGQVVQAAARTTSGTGTATGTAAVTRTTTGTTGTTTATVGSGQLAATGTEGLGLEAGGAAAALAAGAALVVVSRRRRAEES
ncbi:ALF repeat-containing protein [Streptomyces sp. NRRL S-495]|uniref:ALF repeat-containing protein n=1 Tax=Streptomyces sp. NRRL S-495 TaxID=1609133 RepID=UPI0005F98CB7|nr:ALF repeat-containing protein [Streptomyces sp. NRRL S-495]KJY28887.1 hypothetical protein VR45_31330 [Streptomyces sp. NRRL S-495]